VKQWEDSERKIVTPAQKGKSLKIDLTIPQKLSEKEKSSISTT